VRKGDEAVGGVEALGSKGTRGTCLLGGGENGERGGRVRRR